MIHSKMMETTKKRINLIWKERRVGQELPNCGNWADVLLKVAALVELIATKSRPIPLLLLLLLLEISNSSQSRKLTIINGGLKFWTKKSVWVNLTSGATVHFITNPSFFLSQILICLFTNPASVPKLQPPIFWLRRGVGAFSWSPRQCLTRCWKKEIVFG